VRSSGSIFATSLFPHCSLTPRGPPSPRVCDLEWSIALLPLGLSARLIQAARLTQAIRLIQAILFVFENRASQVELEALEAWSGFGRESKMVLKKKSLTSEALICYSG